MPQEPEPTYRQMPEESDADALGEATERASEKRPPPQDHSYKYREMKLEAVTALGDTAASLGLISTLVFSIAVTVVLEIEQEGNEGRLMYMCLATSFSTYTTTYSLLEYYYAQSLKTLAATIEAEIPDHATDLLGTADKKVRKYSEIHTHAELMEASMDIFASFNGMRVAAKNSTWAAICCVLGAAIARTTATEVEDMNASWKACCVFISIFVYLLFCMLAGFTSFDVIGYLVTSLLGAIASAYVAHTHDDETVVARVASASFLALGIVAVTLTVRAFRTEFMPLLKVHMKVH